MYARKRAISQLPLSRLLVISVFPKYIKILNMLNVLIPTGGIAIVQIHKFQIDI